MATKYAVLTRRPPPYGDAGYWTEHYDLRDAIRCAKQVAPAMLYRIDYEPGFGTEEWVLQKTYKVNVRSRS